MKIITIEKSRDWLWPGFAVAMWSAFFMSGCDVNRDPVQPIPVVKPSPTPAETIYSGTIIVDPGKTSEVRTRPRWTPPPGQS